MNLDLFQGNRTNPSNTGHNAPLAERMRPAGLSGFIGQSSLIGKDKILRKQIESGTIGSILFWGPPGCGKTTLARIVASESEAEFHQISAVSAGVKDIKTIIEAGEKNLRFNNRKTLLFIDEIHRFNKAQQDHLLHSVEEGTIILIGATTENPSFEVISPLLSRCRVYRLTHLTDDELKSILINAINNDPVIGELNPSIEDVDIEKLILLSGGDARILLNSFEAALMITEPDENGKRKLTAERIEHVLQKKAFLYDKAGEYHYDIISAFIKSLRGSDPDAAAYWMMRMLEGGEDPKFIARRMVIFASEDIGNADPYSITLATSIFTAVNYVGMPEAEIILMHGTTYLASAPKSNAVVTAVKSAQKAVKELPDASVPMHIRNAPTKYMASEGYGKGYKYPHEYEGNFIDEKYLPDEFADQIFYIPTENGSEKKIKDRLDRLWKKRQKNPGSDKPYRDK